MDELTRDLRAQASLKSRARGGKYSALAVCEFEQGVVQAIPVEGNLTAPIITGLLRTTFYHFCHIMSSWLQITLVYTMKSQSA